MSGTEPDQSKKIDAPRFVVSVNGEQKCVAGVDGFSVVGMAIEVVHVRRSQDQPEFLDAAANLRVGGLVGGDHINWLTDFLVVGDALTVRIGSGGPVSPLSDIPPEQTHKLVEPMKSCVRKRVAEVGDVPVKRVSIALNGESVCTAGIDRGVMTFVLDWVRRDYSTLPPYAPRPDKDEVDERVVTARLGGLVKEVHMWWYEADLSVGDELSITMLPAGPSDEPIEEHPQIPPPKERVDDVFETERLLVRELKYSDAPFLNEVLGDAEVMRFWPAPLDRGEVMQWIGRQKDRYRKDWCGYWLMIDKATGEPVGQVGVLMTEVDGERLPCLGYIVHKKFWRRGYATEAARACIEYVRDGLKRDAVYSLVRPENEPSIGVARKLGMMLIRTVQYEGFDHVLYQLPLTQPEATH